MMNNNSGAKKDNSGDRLDLFSTSQTTSQKCHNRAPYLYIQTGQNAKIIQACCNDWTCPRCGTIRARQEYGRIVNGVKEIYESGHTGYFYTLTCRGREMSVQEAEEGYMKWCNRLLTAMRTKAKRAEQHWTYALVTERQERGHPHSHAIITWIPDDTVLASPGAQLEASVYAKRERLWSDWLHQRITDANLGRQWDLTEIRSHEGTSKYIAKYLFKSGMNDAWPRGWKRVRYAQNWPKMPEGNKPDIAFPLAKIEDWKRVSNMDVMVRTSEPDVVQFARARGVINVSLIQ